MKKLSKFRTGCLFSLALIFVFAFGFSTAQAQTTAFNFQGRLNDGNTPANGKYDLQFKLYDALTSGNQVNSTISKSNLTLINGVFSTPLDFGAAAFDGGNRFIEIGLRQSVTSNTTPNAFVILGPRQQILSVPYAIRSLRATLADNATQASFAANAQSATNADYATTAGSANTATNATNAQTAVNSQQLGGVAASQYAQKGDYGSVKAMIAVNGSGTITKCYNATLTGDAGNYPCGFSVNRFTAGGYGINFGFDITSYLILLTTSPIRDNSNNYYNAGIYYQFPDTGSPNIINVRTYRAGESATTEDTQKGFTAILFRTCLMSNCPFNSQ